MGQRMGKSLNNRLEQAYARQEALSEQIRTLEKQKAAKDRAAQRKREALVGRAIYTLIAQKAWSEDDLRAIMDGFLTKKVDRALFGLETPDAPVQAATTASKTVAQPANSNQQPSPKHTTDSQASSARSALPAQRLPEQAGQHQLLNEFNL